MLGSNHGSVQINGFRNNVRMSKSDGLTLNKQIPRVCNMPLPQHAPPGVGFAVSVTVVLCVPLLISLSKRGLQPLDLPQHGPNALSASNDRSNLHIK